MKMTEKQHLKRGSILTISGGILWGISGTCGQYLLQVKGLDSDWLVPVRLLCAGILLLFLCYIKQGKQIFAPWKSKKDGADLLIFGMVGMSMCQYTYFTAIGYSNAGTATVLQYIGPVLIMLYVSARAGKIPGRYELLAAVLAMAGTFLLATHGKPGNLVISDKALFWGLCSAAALAVYTTQPGRLLKKYGSMVIAGWGMLIGGILLSLIFRPWEKHLFLDTQAVFGMLDLLGFACIISTIFLLTSGKE
ncbi:DMT family transporter [Lacrimispora amygdalina]|uniref:DMT family transporter n=1 Tax=Lacrimispora amygdalina TaxID=253257 RepID=UPI000BE33282|nr:DMT family transporter [Lacrimispora amygdalina]